MAVRPLPDVYGGPAFCKCRSCSDYLLFNPIRNKLNGAIDNRDYVRGAIRSGSALLLGGHNLLLSVDRLNVGVGFTEPEFENVRG